jgi:hypothetical protein
VSANCHALIHLKRMVLKITEAKQLISHPFAWRSTYVETQRVGHSHKVHGGEERAATVGWRSLRWRSSVVQGLWLIPQVAPRRWRELAWQLWPLATGALSASLFASKGPLDFSLGACS